MKILIVSQQFRNTRSGVGLHALNLVKSLISDNHDVTLLVPKDETPENPVQNLKLETVAPPNHHLRQGRWFGLALRFKKKISRILTSEKFDLIHFTDARESFFIEDLKIPIVGNINDTYSADLKPLTFYLENYSDGFRRWIYYNVVHVLEKNRLRKLDCVIVNSEFTKKTILEAYNLENVCLCYKSVDLVAYKTSVLKHMEKNKEQLKHPSALFVGSNLYRKGIPDLLKALAILKAEGVLLDLKVVGEENVPRDIGILTETLGLEQSVEFLGLVPQGKLREYYRNTSLYVLPSLTEALGVSILEALACGVPVVATKVGGIPEIISDGVNGLLVEPHSPGQLANAIRRILEEPELKERFKNNSQDVLERFSLDAMMECTYHIYKQLIQAHL